MSAKGAAPAHELVLRAGGLVPLPDGASGFQLSSGVELVAARRYRHPALGDRAIVRLVPEPIGPAEDLALETLDFALDGVTPVALGSPRGLGFPASAILADPANARHALAVVKEMERYARMARTKPGNARLGFDGIGTRLARSVPQFLPSYYEQVGRAFLEAGNHAQAASAFGQAREAEHTYALPVDESRRRQAFLEFALGGALSAKALAEYARDLVASSAPLAAHTALKELVVQRTLGGLPPWTGMAAELRRTAKAAGLDVSAEEADVLRLLVEAPATAKAPTGFWIPYRAALVRLGQAEPAFRGHLLNLHPAPPERSGFADWWIGLLRDAGALAGLLNPDAAPPEARAVGGASAWLERTARQAAPRYVWARTPQRSEALLALVAELGPMIRATHHTVDLFVNGWADLDLTDAAIAAGVGLEVPDLDGNVFGGLNLREYANRSDRGSLPAIDGSPQISQLLDKAIAGTIGERANALAEIPGLHAGVRRWLRRQVDEASDGTLQTLAGAVFNLKRGATPAVRTLDPDATQRIGRIDVARALARTLRGGLLAEFAWPALESADIAADQAQLGGFAWPNVIVRDKRRAVVVGPDRVTLSHDLRIPSNAPEWGRGRMVHANGQLFVGWRGVGGATGYWSGHPNDQFEPRGELAAAFSAWAMPPETSLELADGSRCEGSATFRAGDTSIGTPRRVVSDGVSAWVLTEGGVLRELDPATGRAGRASRPSFFEAWVEEDWTLDLDASWLMPLPVGAAATAIGSRDGLIGFRARNRQVDGKLLWQVEGVDGRRFEGQISVDGRPFARTARPVALLTLPGDTTPRLVVEAPGSIALLEPGSGRLLLRTNSGTAGGIARGTGPGPDTRDLRLGVDFLPPARFWHAFQARDPGASRALRAVSDPQAKRLLEAARADRLVDPLGKRLEATNRAIDAELPAVKDARLRRAVTGAMFLAADSAVRLEELAKVDAVHPRGSPSLALAAAEASAEVAHRPAAAPAPLPTVLDDRLLNRALMGLQVGPGWEWGLAGGRPIEQVEAVARVVDRPAPAKGLVGRLLARTVAPAPTTLPPSQVTWFEVLPRLGALAFKAAVATTPDEQRWSLTTFLQVLAAQHLASRAGELRVLWVRRVQPSTGGQERLSWTADRALLVKAKPSLMGTHAVPALEWARGGRFKLEADYTIEAEWRPGRGWADDERLEVFLKELLRHGPVAWDPAAVDILVAATGLGRGAAALLLAGLPRIDVEEHNFLLPQARELMGLKVAEAKAGAQQLRHLTTAQRLEVLDAAMPTTTAELWRDGLKGAARRIGARWVATFGRQVAIDDGLGVAASKAIVLPGGPRDPLRLFADPGDPRLRTVPRVAVIDGWNRERDTTPALVGPVVRTLAVAIPWLHATAPTGEPLLGAMPGALAATQATLREPTQVLRLEYSMEGEALASLLSSLGARPWQAPRGVVVSAASALLAGPFVVVPNTVAGRFTWIYLVPSLMVEREPQAITALLLPAARTLLESVRFLLNDADAIVDRAATSPIAAGTYEANPGASAPGTLAEVVATTGLTPEAAVLLLQVMALPGPTKAAVLRWNDWSARTYSKATAALADSGLLVRAQRARAGRDLFLGGPWANLSAPDLPVEAWKLPLYSASTAADGTVAKPLDRLLPLVPLHELFARAWVRWQSGDRPVFEQPGARP